ncbi:glutathione synthase [Marinivivus vitaminiproducens]|uniref:glutathione synthase n=1 Tax=Marinivivus vitaminiproducens TaxID=3035935 RepID=UPI00279C4237|nr:glutathione synthase [Geminicoccaceae bacterium SCSIO 64248]
MSLAVAIQMDPIEPIDINADSTFVLALEAERRGHGLYHYLPKDLSYRQGRIYAKARPLNVRRVKGDHFTLGPVETIDLAALDVVLMRQDPPFDMAYIGATHLLERIHPRTLVVNDPAEVRNAPEKLFVTHFVDLMPPTLITHDPAEIRAFRQEYQDIIVKPLYGNGGSRVFHIRPEDDNLNALLEFFASTTNEPLMVQRYLPEVRAGDKRVILIDGEPAGAINRVPASGEARANMHSGGRAEKADMTERDREICALIGPTLKEKGLVFVGIDVIGPYLTEINVTSPTGLQEIDRFDGVNLEGRIWDVIESKRASLLSV